MARTIRSLFGTGFRRVRLAALMIARHWMPSDIERHARADRIANRAALSAERRRAAAAFRWTVLTQRGLPSEGRHE